MAAEKSEISSFCSLSSVKYLMHPPFKKADELSYTSIGAAIEVRRLNGPGLIESIYEKCVILELSLRNSVMPSPPTSGSSPLNTRVWYSIEPLRFEVLVEDCLLLELKCVESIL
jgi:GxxExxY protein